MPHSDNGNSIPVYIVDYHSDWPRVFRRLNDVLSRQLGDLALRIEHVGSTSVPGLSAKPIIDLSVVIESRDVLPQVIRLLEELGYDYEGDKGIVGREAFGRAGKDVPRDGHGTLWMTHHLYVCAHDATQLAQQLAFRDYLRAHPDVADEYGALKRGLAEQFRHDREGYTEAKTDFVLGVIARAQRPGESG